MPSDKPDIDKLAEQMATQYFGASWPVFSRESIDRRAGYMRSALQSLDALGYSIASPDERVVPVDGLRAIASVLCGYECLSDNPDEHGPYCTSLRAMLARARGEQ